MARLYPAPGFCPVCGGKMVLKELGCTGCGAALRGEFEMSKFAYLSKEELDFVECFIKCAGSLKDLQGELGISYPTARKQLNAVISALGYNAPRDDGGENEASVLDALARGELTVSDAIELLKK